MSSDDALRIVLSERSAELDRDRLRVADIVEVCQR